MNQIQILMIIIKLKTRLQKKLHKTDITRTDITNADFEIRQIRASQQIVYAISQYLLSDL